MALSSGQAPREVFLRRNFGTTAVERWTPA